MTRSLTSAKEFFINLDKKGNEIGPPINENKTKITTQMTPNRQNTTTDEYELENDRQLYKLRRTTDEIKRLIQLVNRAFYSVLLVSNDIYILRKTKF